MKVSALESQGRCYHERLQIAIGEAQELDTRLQPLTSNDKSKGRRCKISEVCYPRKRNVLKGLQREAQDLEVLFLSSSKPALSF